ncbi:MAG TPA: hypothetical protein ENN27_05085 [Candidatus Atribacteria bacterium]|nr:hypothetical protein [Candidatus Atribacteria bacterium]
MFDWNSKETPSIGNEEQLKVDLPSSESDKVELGLISEEAKEKITDKIKQTDSFSELYQLLDELEGLEIGQNKVSPRELKFFIGLVNTNRADIDSISSEYGLRSKVRELKEKREMRQSENGFDSQDKKQELVGDKIDDNVDKLEFSGTISRSELENKLNAPAIDLKDFSFVGPASLFTEKDLKVLLDKTMDDVWVEKENLEENDPDLFFDLEANFKEKLISAFKERRLEKGFIVSEIENHYTPFSDEATSAYEDWDRKQVDSIISSIQNLKEADENKVEELKKWIALSLAQGNNWEDLEDIRRKYPELWDKAFIPGSTERLSLDKSMDSKEPFVFSWLTSNNAHEEVGLVNIDIKEDNNDEEVLKEQNDEKQNLEITSDLEKDDSLEKIGYESTERIREMLKENGITVNPFWLADIFKADIKNTLLDQELTSWVETLGFDLEDGEVRRSLVLLQRIYSKSFSLDNFKKESEDLISSALDNLNGNSFLGEDKKREIEKVLREEVDRIRVERLKDDLSELIKILKRKKDNDERLKLLLSKSN